MRVGIVCPYDLSAPGGVQQLTTELAAEIRRRGDEVVLVGAGRHAHDMPQIDETTVRAGRSFTIRANRSRVPLTLSPLSWRRVRRALAEVDVVHVHEPLVPLVGWVALGSRRPTVATFHAAPPHWVHRVYRWAPIVGRRLQRAVLTAVSETAAQALPSGWGPVEIIPNAIDTSAYDLPVRRVHRRVCFLGRDEPRKGLNVLLEAWRRIHEAVPDAELKVMGADRRQSLPGVDFLGRVTGGEKNRMLASSLVYVAPNTGGESFGIVIAEAMAAGCAVVCSDLPAFRDVVDGDGRLVPVGDADALAEEVIALLSDPTAARALGERGRASVKRFDWATIVDRYRQVYRRALS
jgi:phosphatidyl-myo-inositol alpha-mannosyltransferase